MSTKFPILNTLSGVIKAIGFVLFLLGAGSFVYTLYDYLDHNRLNYIFLIYSISILIFSFFVTAYAELIKVFLTIEENTRTNSRIFNEKNTIQKTANLQSLDQIRKIKQENQVIVHYKKDNSYGLVDKQEYLYNKELHIKTDYLYIEG
jgi:hypothetical protein